MDAVGFVCCCPAGASPERVIHFTSGELAPPEVSAALRGAYERGEREVSRFSERLCPSTDGITVWDHRTNTNLRTWHKHSQRPKNKAQGSEAAATAAKCRLMELAARNDALPPAERIPIYDPGRLKRGDPCLCQYTLSPALIAATSI